MYLLSAWEQNIHCETICKIHFQFHVYFKGILASKHSLWAKVWIEKYFNFKLKHIILLLTLNILVKINEMNCGISRRILNSIGKMCFSEIRYGIMYSKRFHLKHRSQKQWTALGLTRHHCVVLYTKWNTNEILILSWIIHAGSYMWISAVSTQANVFTWIHDVNKSRSGEKYTLIKPRRLWKQPAVLTTAETQSQNLRRMKHLSVQWW